MGKHFKFSNVRGLGIAGFILTVLTLNASGQATFNKKAGGPIGEGPKTGNFSGAYSLGTVDKSTGTLNVNLPLYEIKVHDISIPISISYSALGLKVGQEAGAPGMGWELNAGGKINKQVNGIDDEETWSPSVKSTSPINLDPDNNSNHRDALTAVMNGQSDYAYDIFSYTVPSGSGRFSVQGQTFPYDPTFKYDSGNRRITTGNGLVHHFSNGNKLIVSKRKFYKQKYSGSADLEYVPGGIWESKTYTSDYNLDMITSPKTKDTVKFVYEQFDAVNPYGGLPGKTRVTSIETLPFDRDMTFNTANQLVDVNGNYFFIGEPSLAETKTEINKHVRLKEITYATGKVEFKYNTENVLSRDVLSEVNVFRKVNGVYTRFKYYQFVIDPDKRYGHYLTQVNIFNAAGVKSGHFKFDYFSENLVPELSGKLPIDPTSNSKAKDRWGFFNGHIENKTLLEYPDSLISLRDLPHLIISRRPYGGSTPGSFDATRTETKLFYDSLSGLGTVNVSWANRSTDSLRMIWGTLRKITAPTGEVAEYAYELHRYRVLGTNSSNQNYYKVYRGGGLRVKSVLLRDGSMFSGQQFSKKVYTYGSATFSSPHTNAESGWGFVTTPGVISSSECTYILDGNTPTTRENLQVSSHPLNDLVIHSGSYAYYPSVTESTYSGMSLKNQTVYYYMFGSATGGGWNYPLPNSTSDFNFPEFNANVGVKRDEGLGQLAMVVDYNSSRTSGSKARSTVFNYVNYNAPGTVPKAYNVFGGVKGTRKGAFTSSFGGCNIVEDPAYPGLFKFACLQLGTIANMDPLGYKENSIETQNNYYAGKYQQDLIELSTLSNTMKLVSTTTTTWNTVYVDSVTNVTKTEYNNSKHMLPTMVTNFSSQGDTTATRIKYPLDFLDNTVPGVALMRGANIQTDPVEQLSLVKKNGVFQITGGVLNTMKSENGLIVSDKIYGFNTGGKLVPVSNDTEIDLRYKQEAQYEVYDNMGNLCVYSNLKGPKTAMVWGYGGQYPIAEVVNVSNTYDFAFTNFEGNDKSYWNYSGTPVSDASSPSGDRVYPLSSGAITKQYYVGGKKYIIGYWYKKGSVVSVSGGTVGAEVIKNTKGDWVFVERTLTASTPITISGTGTIDELRFHPADAMMRTFNYIPGLGISNALDARGVSAAYEYDNEQRVKAVKDQNGNIVKAYDYNIGRSYRE
ncbi:MAG: hypothetical protein V4594_25010 [Bacteroidota bacterium]